MKSTIYTLLFSLCFISCGGDPGSSNRTEISAETPMAIPADAELNYVNNVSTTTAADKVHQLRDARTGLVVGSTQYPADWNVISKPIYTIDQKLPSFLVQVSGPSNLRSFNTPTTTHVAFQDPQMASWMYNTPYEKLLRPLVPPQQIFEEEVKGRMQKSGFTYIGTRNQPRIQETMQNNLNRKLSVPGNVSVYSTEWRNQSGQKALVGINLVSLQQPTISGYMMVWFYTIYYTVVNEAAYEKTVDAMEKAVVNYRENPGWEQYVAHLKEYRARLNEQRLRESAASHQGRMNARWASFNAHQDRMKSLSIAQDANHAAFMNRNFGPGSDSGQRQFLNMINEEETVYNPLNGKQYQVNAGSTEYWMDSEGNYIRNDDLFYTPNGDINLNQREWVKVGSY